MIRHDDTSGARRLLGAKLEGAQFSALICAPTRTRARPTEIFYHYVAACYLVLLSEPRLTGDRGVPKGVAGLSVEALILRPQGTGGRLVAIAADGNRFRRGSARSSCGSRLIWARRPLFCVVGPGHELAGQDQERQTRT